MRNNKQCRGWAIVPDRPAVPVVLEGGRIVDSPHLTCVWAGTERFHEWFVERLGVVGWIGAESGFEEEAA